MVYFFQEKTFVVGQTCARLSDVTALDPQITLFQIKTPKLEEEET